MYYIGRFLQLVGLGVTGIGIVEAFDPATPERVFWMFALSGLVVFYAGHAMMPKK